MIVFHIDLKHKRLLVILFYLHIHGLFAILAVKLDCSVRRNTMRSKKCDHITSSSIGKVRIQNLCKLFLTDSPYFQKLLRLLIQNQQGILSKGIVDPLCSLFSYAFDLTGSKISDNAFLGGGNDFLVALNLKLDSVPGIFASFAF